MAQVGLALLCFCFTLLLSGILSPNLASFSPKPFGHVSSLLYHYFSSKHIGTLDSKNIFEVYGDLPKYYKDNVRK